VALFRFTFRAMEAEHELTIDAADASTAAAAARAATAEVQRIEAKYSRYRDDAITSRINRAAGRAAVPIDTETAALLRYADECHRLSDAAFDVTSGVLRRAWDFRRDPPRLPQASEVDALRRLIGWARVEWSETSIRLPEAGMEIDFGGIGKEYAADRAATVLADAGVANALVNLAGDVRALGSQPTGAPWRVGIVHPRKPGGVIGAVELRDAAVATSGDYERYFEIQGRRYCHILDPRTGWPMDRWQSVSVVAPLCIVAGSLATIAMLRPDAATFLREQRYRFLLVDRDGGIVSDETPQAS
jgi:thiamine biosynthesis lipoprotein